MRNDWVGRALALGIAAATILATRAACAQQAEHPPSKGRPGAARSKKVTSKTAAATPAPAPSTLLAPDAPARDAAVLAPVATRRLNEVGQEILQLSLGMEGGMRHFNYADGLSNNLRSYQLSAAPLASAEGALYPFMLSATPVLRDVGLVLGYARAFALQSTASDAGTVSTQWSRYYIGGHVRIRTGSDGSPVLGLTGAYGDESFAFGGTQASSLPSVNYRFVRASGDIRVPIGRFALFAQAGYLFVLSAGDVAARFPKATVGGVEGELGGAFTLLPGLEARVTASYRRFFYSMNPTPGDGYVAGGALDEFGGLLASVAYVY